ncbi:MAG: hypothetical protein FJ135_09470 [Deltaproteobacteria bacterium]|nr:hypothetical protein [Deltaproteobacteria bacterium]
MSNKLDLYLSATQSAYAHSDALINVIIGPAGEGKTYASVGAMIISAQRNKRPVLWAVIRDTHTNIKRSTVRSINKIFRKTPSLVAWRDDYRQLAIHCNPKVEVDLFGIDDPGALNRLQGTEYDGIWLEEPAAMLERANSGLSEEVFNDALLRCVRAQAEFSRLQVSMNPADEEHWTFPRLVEAPDVDPENPLITKKVFWIQPGENIHLKETARQAARSAYKNDPAAYERYVLGKFAAVYRGERVTPEYNQEWHRSPDPIIPAPGLVGFRFWDGWHNPACLIGQRTKLGRLIHIDTLFLPGGDIGSLIDRMVLPLMESPRWKDKCFEWRDIGDRTMLIPDQSRKQHSAAKVIEEKLGGRFEPGPSKWPILKLGIKRVLNMNIQGMPAYYLSPTEKLLHKGLKGAWHYKTDNSGKAVSNIPEKDEISHVCEAWANGVCVMLPANVVQDVGSLRQAAGRAKKRAQTYAVGG